MPDKTLRVADEFVEGLSAIYSPRLLNRIEKALKTIAELPEIGSPNVRKSLEERFGGNIRKLAVSTFVIVYRVEAETIDVLALAHGPSVT